MKCLNADAVDLISKRTYDFAATMSSAQGKWLAVSLNSGHLKIKRKKEEEEKKNLESK